MVFSNLIFLCLFLPVVIVVYYVVPSFLKNFFLLLASLAFYSWGEPRYIILMLVSIVFNYGFGLLIQGGSKKRKTIFISIAIIINLALLGYYKYANFLVDNINLLLQTDFEMKSLALPIGISFYTFHSISYLIDIYREKSKAQKNPFTLALYIALFPQLVAGPIVRYHSISDQLGKRIYKSEMFVDGIKDFAIGLGKKVLIANQMGIIADEIFNAPQDNIGTSLAWIGIVSYSLQILFDFSGYSQMAIGLGKMLGFQFPENFNYPYISKSISEFWRRWHMTLGSWFRDYVYIPLGGNRVSKWKVYRNLFIVWSLTGLWHGATWNFIVWGIYYGLIIALEKAGLENLLKKLPLALQHAYTILLFMIGWVFFRANDIGDAFHFLGLMFGVDNHHSLWNGYVMFYIQQGWIEFTLGVIACTPIISRWVAKLPSQGRLWAGPAFYMILLVLCLAQLTAADYNPFIYFRF